MTGHNWNKVFPEKLLNFLPRMFMSSCVWEKESPPQCMEKWRLEILEAQHGSWGWGEAVSGGPLQNNTAESSCSSHVSSDVLCLLCICFPY